MSTGTQERTHLKSQRVRGHSAGYSGSVLPKTVWKGILPLIHTETGRAHHTGSLASPSRELIAQPEGKTFLRSETLHKALTHEDMGYSNLGIIRNSNHDSQPSENPVHRCDGPAAREQCRTGSFMKYAKSTTCSSNQSNRAFVNSQTVRVIFYFLLFLRHDKFFPMRDFQNRKTKAGQIREGPGVSIKCRVLWVTSSMKGK